MPVAFFFMDSMLQSFDQRFVMINQRSLALVKMLPSADLFRKPRELERSMTMFSCGEYVLRSAAAVEQSCGGITTRLWDDPFEWTLPEELSTTAKLIEYLDEVERGRLSAFRFFTSDADLSKRIPAPETLRSIFELLLETIARSEHYQGRAFAVFQMLSNEKLPRI
jgi:hypothetical protein